MDQAKHNGLKNSTRQLCLRDTFPQRIVPYLGHLRLDKASPDIVRDWHSVLKEHLRVTLQNERAHIDRPSQVRDGSSTVARSYRLLRSIINTAVEDEIIQRNPCRIKGAGNTKAAERPALGLPEIRDLAQAMPEHYRALVQPGPGAALSVERKPNRRRCRLAGSTDLAKTGVFRRSLQATGPGTAAL